MSPSFTVTLRHNGDDKVHEVLAMWGEDNMQDLAMRLNALDPSIEFHMKIAQEGPGLEPQTSGD